MIFHKYFVSFLFFGILFSHLERWTRSPLLLPSHSVDSLASGFVEVFSSPLFWQTVHNKSRARWEGGGGDPTEPGMATEAVPRAGQGEEVRFRLLGWGVAT